MHQGTGTQTMVRVPLVVHDLQSLKVKSTPFSTKLALVFKAFQFRIHQQSTINNVLIGNKPAPCVNWPELSGVNLQCCINIRETL